jgi:hypothetical protein
MDIVLLTTGSDEPAGFALDVVGLTTPTVVEIEAPFRQQPLLPTKLTGFWFLPPGHLHSQT